MIACSCPQSPVPVRNRLRLGVCPQGTPEGGRRVWENAGARVGFVWGLVWGAAWVVGLGAGLGGISWRGKKTPAIHPGAPNSSQKLTKI